MPIAVTVLNEMSITASRKNAVSFYLAVIGSQIEPFLLYSQIAYPVGAQRRVDAI